MGLRRSMPAAMLHGTPRSTACTATRPQLALVPSTCAYFGSSKPLVHKHGIHVTNAQQSDECSQLKTNWLPSNQPH